MSSQSDLWMTSSSPHAHSGETVRGLMFNVVAALLPALDASIYFFGWNAVRLTVLCVAASVAAEVSFGVVASAGTVNLAVVLATGR